MTAAFGGAGGVDTSWGGGRRGSLRCAGLETRRYYDLVPTGQAGWYFMLVLAYHPHPCYTSNLITALKSVP